VLAAEIPEVTNDAHDRSPEMGIGIREGEAPAEPLVGVGSPGGSPPESPPFRDRF
jgi:hypothetical protein